MRYEQTQSCCRILFLPAGIWQALFGWPHIDVKGGPLRLRILIPFEAWPFNVGGYTIRRLFELTVGPLEFLVGHRSATVMSNLSYYLFLMIIQVCILAYIFAGRYRRQQKPLDWLLISLGILFLINSLANVSWFWAGT